jgi:DNA (cytosine-5)-methyltransferase 1
MIKFVDLFCGTGGIRLAFEQVCRELDIASECVLSSEIDKKAAKSYMRNFMEDPLCDITELHDFPDFDFLLAGFPCQSFSYAGKQQGFGDTRGTLFFDVERILKKMRPKYFLLENVRGLVSHDRGRTFETIKKKLEEIGYGVAYLLLNSSDFGVPQNRVRIYILGKMNSEVNLTLKSDLGASDTHSFKIRNSSQEIESFLPGLFESKKNECPTVESILENNVPDKYYCSERFLAQLNKVVGHEYEKLHGYRLIDYRGGKSIHSWQLGVKGECTHDEIHFMNQLIANRRRKTFGKHQDGKSLSKEQILSFYDPEKFDVVVDGLVKKGYISINNGLYNPVCGNMSFEVFKFLDPQGISITLTASDSNRLGIVQNNIPRRITPRECARLQGYPDDYKLIEDDAAVYKQMGNGVSVPVIRAVLSDFMTHNFDGISDSVQVRHRNIFPPKIPSSLRA